MIVIFGASGHAKEIAFILKSIGKNVNYFVSEKSSCQMIGNIPIVSESDFFETASKERYNSLQIFIAIGSPIVRKAVYNKIAEKLKNVEFPNLFHNTVIMDSSKETIKMGEGNIFFPGVILTTDIVIGNHNHFNLYSSVSHDCRIGNFNSFSPGVQVAGKVSIGDFNFIGTKAAIIDNLILRDNLIIGAGATVINDLLSTGTYIGLPARKI